MQFHPFEVSAAHVAYTALGGFVVVFGMFSLFFREKLYIGEAIWAFVFGIIIGPYCAGIFDPRGWGGGSEETANAITLELARVVLGVGVFAIGVELPKAYLKRHWRSLAMLLGPIMTYGWFVSAGLIYALIPDLNFLSALAIAACLTPTDPILAAAIIGGKYADKHVPAHLRHLLAAESGCNDGAAFPFLYIALYLTIYGGGPGIGLAIRDWFLILWLYQVVLGIVIGATLGIGFRYMMKYCENHDLIDRHSYVAQYLSLALLATGSTVLLGSDDLLSSFACGTAFAWDGFFNRQTEESVFSSVIDLLFNITAFVYVGAWMPFDKFQEAELSISVWRLIVIAILILVLRRLPVMIAMYRWIPDIKTFREAVFSGHFGPIGIGAVFISTLAEEVLVKHTEEEGRPEQTQLLMDTIQPIVAFMVLASILVHGLSIPGFSLGRRVHSVSRTWSRAAGTAEWTNQTRRAERGDEIVINRDRDEHANEMERGETVEETKTVIPTASTSSGELDEKKKIEHDGMGETATGMETPPDGTETLQEWREGPHKVIEKRAGPGEEVEVEVKENFFSLEATQSSTYNGPEGIPHVRAVLGQEVSKLEHALHHGRHRPDDSDRASISSHRSGAAETREGARNPRLQGLRKAHLGRESSPARSIRFGDDNNEEEVADSSSSPGVTFDVPPSHPS